MNKYKTPIKTILANNELDDLEKIDALKNLIEILTEKENEVSHSHAKASLENYNKKTKFYYRQMILTVVSGIVTMATASKSLEISSVLNNTLLTISGCSTFLNLAFMTAEELGAPFFADDKLAVELKKIYKALNQAEEELKKLEGTATKNDEQEM